MAISRPINPYANLKLRNQIYLEARAMAEFALSKGIAVPADAITTIEAFEQDAGPGEPEGALEQKPIAPLIKAHDELATLVAPASPKTILLLDIEQGRNYLLKFLGPVGLIRQMMLVAIISLFAFMLLPMLPDINTTAGISTQNGMPSLPNLFFYLAAAGLGASFASLYKANSFITQGTFDPAHQGSYWIRFLLGLIAGLVMAVVISEDALKNVNPNIPSLIEEGIIRPLLAILGGFSADLVYTLLNRLVETIKSLFQGSTSQLIQNRAEEARAQAESQVVTSRMQLAAELLKLQQELGPEASSTQVQERLGQLLGELMPNSGRGKQ